MTAESALEGARARWALMLRRLQDKGLPESQRWPFPENAEQASGYLREVHEYLRQHPETLDAGGLYEEYRNRTDEVLGYYSLIAARKAESGKSTWILIAGAVAAVAAMVAAFGSLDQAWKSIQAIVRFPSWAFEQLWKLIRTTLGLS